MTSWDEFEKEISSISQIEKEHIKQTARLVSQIVRRRRALGISQAEVAQRSGLTQSAIARLENESSIPRLDTLEKVALALGMRLEFVMANEEEAAALSI
ncbi:MAG: helix-turn-helix transcriptional regulator [Paenibacillaceae bacterium]